MSNFYSKKYVPCTEDHRLFIDCRRCHNKGFVEVFVKDKPDALKSMEGEKNA